MKKNIEEFFSLVGNGSTEIYNEFSLQHELGVFLRNRISNQKIQFERNVSFFNFSKADLYKKEIDISIYSQSDLFCAIELKYPRNGQVPESMFGFCKDIAFLEQLLENGFKSAYFIAVADDELFYSGNPAGIYGYFRDNKQITGTIRKPTGKKDEEVEIKKVHQAKWFPISGSTKYCLIQVSI